MHVVVALVVLVEHLAILLIGVCTHIFLVQVLSKVGLIIGNINGIVFLFSTHLMTTNGHGA
jgi:hypothetical protein